MTLTWCVRVISVSVLLQFVCHPFGGMMLSDAGDVGTFLEEVKFLKEHGKFMLGNMNLSVHPCEDFYEYACGNWKNNKMMPERDRNNTFLGSMQVRVDEMIQEFLRNTSEMKEDTAETKAKRLFASCVSMTNDWSQAHLTVLNSFTEPVVRENETLDWISLNFHSKHGVTPFLPMSVEQDEHLAYVIQITAPHRFIANLTLLTGAGESDEKETLLKLLKAFEKQLVETVSTSSEFEEQTIEEFKNTYNSSGIDWNRFFNLAFNGTVDHSWKVRSNVKGFQHLNKFLLGSSADVKLKYALFQQAFKFLKTWSEQKIGKTLEANCREVTIGNFGYAIYPWFIEKAFDKKRRTDVLQLAKQLKNTFYSLLDDYNWPDKATQLREKSKLRAMDIMVGYSDEMSHRPNMDSLFEAMGLSENYWETLMEIERFQASKQRNVVGQSNSPTYKTFLVDSHYLPSLNLLFVTIALSQLPLYNIMMPQSLKFGGIGTIISHEILHGFERNWWSEEFVRKFKERYAKNTTDNAAVRIAYHSYLRFLKENPDLEWAKDEPLPRMEFNNKQLFFLKFAQTFCSGRSTKDNRKELVMDKHADDRIRVLGTLMDMPEFSEVFNCPLGSINVVSA